MCVCVCVCVLGYGLLQAEKKFLTEKLISQN